MSVSETGVKLVIRKSPVHKLKIDGHNLSGAQLMVNCWFGARWFGIRIGIPQRNPIPFHQGDPRNPFHHRAPNQQITKHKNARDPTKLGEQKNTRHRYWDVHGCKRFLMAHIWDIYLEPQTTIYKWLFQLDDSKSLYRKLLFHQTSIYKWLFGVPGTYIYPYIYIYIYPYLQSGWL